MRLCWILPICITVSAAPLFADNGIAVGQPKVYDNRSLVIMLDQLNQRLSSVTVVDQKALADALGVQQGEQSKDVTRGLSFSVNPVSPPTSSSAAALPALQTAPAYTPKFGENPEDLLADQVNLTYQIFNLQMLLERSLSDRLLKGKPRLQAVLGFNISLDPPKDAKDSAAIVEITVCPTTNEKTAECGTSNSGKTDRGATTSDAASSDGVSLVSLMPQEKTYNTSALSQHANAFGGSAVASVFTVGYTERRRGQVFYLFRDADTISFERMKDDEDANLPAGSVRFGWEFRPVLGRRAVSPGLRQVFAVLSLPAEDDTADMSPTKLNVTVHTYWRKYDRSTLTTYEQGSGQLSSLFLTRVPTPENRSFAQIPVFTTASSESDLTPVIEHVTWTATDDTTAVVTVTGRNFFSGTTVVLGSKTHDAPATGLIIKNDQAMQINTTWADLVGGGAILNGRYGPSIPFQVCKPVSPPTDPPSCEKRADGFFIESLGVSPEGASSYLLLATLRSLNSVNWDLTTKQLPPLDELPPIVALNGIPVPNTPTLTNLVGQDQPPHGSGAGTGVMLQIHVPASMLKTLDALVTIKFPFFGPGFSAQTNVGYCALKLTRLGGEPSAILAISGISTCAGTNWKLELDQPYDVSTGGPLRSPTPDLLTLEVPSKTLSSFKNLLLLYDVAIPGSKPITNSLVLSLSPPGDGSSSSQQGAAAEPKLDTKQILSIGESDSVSITVAGSDLSGIKSVSFEGKALDFQANNDGTSITVYVTRDVTAKPGKIDLLLHTASGKILAAPVTVTAAANKPKANPSPNKSGNAKGTKSP